MNTNLSQKIIDVLKSSMKGKIVIEEFKQTGVLTKASRKTVIHEIISNICLNKIWLRKNDLIMVVRQILTIFPGEKSVSCATDLKKTTKL